MNAAKALGPQKIYLAILVAALGYFVDVYDIILFTAIRVPSLKALGLADDQITSVGLMLMNTQLVGMLLGGFAFGIVGDKKGRLVILFGSIILYSLANLANAFVTSVEQYAVLRFLAGFGLAGEFGAGITLISELMSKEKRGYGTTIVTTAGVFGGMAGGLVGNLLPWQTAFIVGGVAGIILLILRLGVVESGLFIKIKTNTNIAKGNLFQFFKTPKLAKKYFTCLFIGVPFFIFIGLFMTLAPEIGRALKLQAPVTAGWAILFFNIGLGLGDLSSGILSQIWGSRKKVIKLYLALTLIISLLFLTRSEATPTLFYFFCSALGFSVGYWAVFMMVAAEQFGTNMRAMVTVSVPNVVRAMVIPFTFVLSFLKPNFGILGSLGYIAVACIMLSWMMLMSIEETYAKELDFIES